MTSRTKLYLHIGLLLLIVLCEGRIAMAQTQQFALQNIHLQAGERVVSIELLMNAGSFVEFDPLPMGWYLIIDNDPSQQTSIKGDIRVGAAALGMEELSNLRIRIKKVEFEKWTFSMSGTLIVTKDFEKERKIALSADNFKQINNNSK